ncbi:uncharacterized protein [Acropora muricata]
MIRPRRWFPLACAFVTMISYCSFLMINDLLVARKPIKSVQGEKKEEMLIPENEEKNRTRMNVIIQYPIFNSSDATHEWAVQRQTEVTFCLQQNLLSPHVEKVHILSQSEHHDSYVKSLNLTMAGKLVFQMLGRRIRHKDAFLYASKNLIGKTAIIMNADCFVHKGFELLDENILNNKTMYSLTRHGPSANSSLCPVVDRYKCNPGSRYYGSHDAWVFRLLDPLPDQVLNNIDHLPHLEGIEQVLMFHLRTSGGFTIKNPCKILQIVHYHCVRAPELGNYQLLGGHTRLDIKLGLGIRRKGNLVLAKFSDL